MYENKDIYCYHPPTFVKRQTHTQNSRLQLQKCTRHAASPVLCMDSVFVAVLLALWSIQITSDQALWER